MSDQAEALPSRTPRWVPRDAAWWPSADVRARARARVLEHPPERFERFEDYFFFIHIHPMNRWVHVIGMWIGLAVFAVAAWLLVAASWWCVPVFFIGHLFFTGFGILGHIVYDGTLYARTDGPNFLRAFPWVIRINVDTLTGRFAGQLADFVERYPWVREVWDLVDDHGRDDP